MFSNYDYAFYLAMHIGSFYLFLVKEQKSEFPNGLLNEKYYCEHFMHRCLTRFYGYLINNNKMTGFVYEFMCNGTLEDFYSNSKNTIDDIHCFMTICRIFQAFNYLHSHSIMHRDLKPQNILIDHNFITYVSDFNSIRDINRTDEITKDWASAYYVSPEQEKGKEISTSTDIYSFDLIIYFLFEKKDLLKSDINLKKADISITPNVSENLKELYLECVTFLKKKVKLMNQFNIL